MIITEHIHEKLHQSLSPEYLAVSDSSASHYGHDGATPGIISHVAILIVASIFEGKSRLERQRLAYAAIDTEIRQIHAITELKTHTPDEYRKMTLQDNLMKIL